MFKRSALAILAATAAISVAAPAQAAVSFSDVLGASGVTDYRLTFAGGAYQIDVGIVDFDPYIYLFEDDGSSLTAKTGALVTFDDDSGPGLSSLISGNLSAGNYVLSVGRFFFDESQARAGAQDANNAGLRYDVQLSDGASLNNGVPEPATWAMMMLGFGLVGAAMRRRSPAAAIA